MIISRKRYNDLIAKIDDAKKVVDAENKLIKAMLATKQERDTLIDDLKVLREKNAKLECENGALRDQNYKYCKLGNHIRLKAENNPGVSRYIDLVNYIDRLEKGEN